MIFYSAVLFGIAEFIYKENSKSSNTVEILILGHH